MTCMDETTPTDEQIRKMAKARVEFKQHLAAYIIINAMLIGIWALTTGFQAGHHWASFWPIWTLLFWGVGLAFHGVNAYNMGAHGIYAKEEARLREKYRK